MKTIIAGSRDINDMRLVLKAIADSGFEITEVVCGEANGVDSMGKEWAKTFGISVKSFPADWDNVSAKDAVVKMTRYGRKYNAIAGHQRNQKMADYADALICIHRNTKGSLDMVKRATGRGLKVWEVVV